MAATNTPRTLTVEEAAHQLGISRYLAYEQARTGQLAGVDVPATKTAATRRRVVQIGGR